MSVVVEYWYCKSRERLKIFKKVIANFTVCIGLGPVEVVDQTCMHLMCRYPAVMQKSEVECVLSGLFIQANLMAYRNHPASTVVEFSP